ncbi:MAG: type II secretion system GspH family protein [Rhodocyclales bacterium]|nr:type II secretion system GspH family protein [Rhodocyclales bacterium]
MSRRLPRRAAGFTLIEAIIAIVITGILGSVVAVFINRPIQGYFDSVRRAELTDQADVALRRISRDIRLALPNSLRVTAAGGVNYIEFIMTSAGGRYRDAADGSTGGNFIDFTGSLANPSCLVPPTPSLCFDVLGPMPASPPVVAGDFIVIYNLGTGNPPADAYTGGNRALVQGVVGNVITLAANPFAAQTPPLPSPDARFQVVRAGTRAVTYACAAAGNPPGNLTRQWNYGFNAAQGTPPAGGTTAILAGNSTCTVEYAANASGRNGLLLINLTLTQIDAATGIGESVILSQQIRIDNAP